jgi:undecaprenyl-diphosphatase
MGSERLPVRHAVALGLLQGPTEFLPVSSSAHTALVPWLAGWPWAELDAELRKAFEVALHLGSAGALAIDMRAELTQAIARLDRRQAAVIALALAPPVLAGYALQRLIERRLGGPRSTAAGLVAGAVALALADRERSASPRRGLLAFARANAGPRTGARPRESARPGDGLALGLAQAAALFPGVSRRGATLSAARACGFGRTDADVLSWHVALPVILGAGALKGVQLAGLDVPSGARTGLLAGGAAAFLSTLASARLLRREPRDRRALLACSIYRCLLAALVTRRLRDRVDGV